MPFHVLDRWCVLRHLHIPCLWVCSHLSCCPYIINLCLFIILHVANPCGLPRCSRNWFSEGKQQYTRYFKHMFVIVHLWELVWCRRICNASKIVCLNIVYLVMWCEFFKLLQLFFILQYIKQNIVSRNFALSTHILPN